MFAILLIATAVKMLLLKTDAVDPNRNPVVRLAWRLFPVTERFHGGALSVSFGLRRIEAGRARHRL